MTRKAVNYKGYGVPAGGVKEIPLGLKGVAGSRMAEAHPVYIKADNEKVITDSNGSYIVLGRDRPGSRISGYGSHHLSSRIDLVVGRMAEMGDKRAVNANGDKLHVDPSFEHDAARIYISAKANIDEYFKLRPGKVGSSKARSGIGIKADAVRVMGREGIKLVTRPNPKNSLGGTIEFAKGIDLIAGNDDTDLQPMVKGDNLLLFLDNMANWISKLNGIMTTVLLDQIKLNTAMQFHTHPLVNPITPGLTAPSPELMTVGSVLAPKFTFNGVISQTAHRVNLEFLKLRHLKPYGRDYILSRYNNVN